MDEDDRKRKREKNNESVRKCRLNEKLKIEAAREELSKFKKEYQELTEKYQILQKELGTLKSLFQTSSNVITTACQSLQQQNQTCSIHSVDQPTVNKEISLSTDETKAINSLEKELVTPNIGIELNDIFSDPIITNTILNDLNESKKTEHSDSGHVVKRKFDDLS